ncbi:hypothetical protein [Paenibacillus polysaccharolyticus]|uniref:hypothetical protein n=1 Tax=Paenibacillus polysaccharolyticus TaxID=582692 RepID=UPI00280B96DA|nr:hypothetical protein [Paenibacillus polysaccharolyticus]
MQGIFNTVSLMWQLQVITLVNCLIYFMQRLPVVGPLISDQTYAAFRAKRTLGAVAVVLMFGAGLLESLIYFCGMLALPILLWTEDHYTDRFVLALHMYFCISGVMGAVTGAKVLETNKMKYTAIKLMRIAPTRFMRAILFHRYTTFFLYQGIAFTLVSLFFNFSISHVLLVVGIMTCWRVLCEFLHLAIFQQKGIVLIQKTWATSLTMLIALALAYLPLTQWSIPLFGATILDQRWFVTIIVLSGTVAGYILLKHTEYAAAVRAVTNNADPLLNTELMIADLQQRMIQSKGSDLSQPSSTNLHVIEQSVQNTVNKKGYEQMHDLFVKRHSNLLLAPFHRRLIAIMIIGLLLSCLAFIFKDHISLNEVERFTPLLILAMLSLTVGSQICKMLFYHCDIPLMRYAFYRKDAKQHSLLRFKYILSTNLKLGLCFAAVTSVPVLILSEGRNIDSLLAIWILIITLAVFFSVHHLLLYYVLQPYTAELDTNHPLFTIMNTLISLSIVVAIFLGTALWLLTAAIIVLTVGYLFSAVPLVSKYAHHHFRVK